MKKVLAIILALLFVLSFAACGESIQDIKPTPAESLDNTVDEAETAEETTIPAMLVPAGTDYGGETLNILNCIYFNTDGFYLNAE